MYSPKKQKVYVQFFLVWFYDDVKMYRTFLVKVGLLSFKENRFIYVNESPLKIMKNVFLFHVESTFTSQVFKSLSWLLGRIEKNRMIRNIRLIMKIYDLTNWLANTYTAQKMKFSIKDFFSKFDQSAVFCGFGHIY